MAAKLTRRQATLAKDCIDTVKIIKRLQDHLHSNPEVPLLRQSQVAAARILLAKTIPDLKSTEISGPDGQAATFVIKGVPE